MSRLYFHIDSIGAIAPSKGPVSSPLTSYRPFHIHTWLFRHTGEHDSQKTECVADRRRFL